MYQKAATDAPARLGRYELVTRLASGGMGEIYLARLRGEGGFDKLIALKLLLPELVASERFTAMFLDEARIASRLSHPNVCEIHELGRDQGRYFIAMQYLQGLAVSELCGSGVRDPRLLASLAIQACEGLHHAHELCDAGGEPLGVVHRDVSPSNLFVTFDGVLKVLDFGIAKAQGASSRTARDEIKGTYAYMSPEQLRGEVLDRRSDVFGLGIVLFETLSGRRLFGRDSDFLAAKAIIEEPIPRLDEVAPEVPAALAQVVAGALERDRERRLPSARALADALREALDELGGTVDALAIGRELRERFGDRLAAQTKVFAEASAPGTALREGGDAALGHGAEDASVAAQAPAPLERDETPTRALGRRAVDAPGAAGPRRRWLAAAAALAVASAAGLLLAHGFGGAPDRGAAVDAGVAAPAAQASALAAADPQLGPDAGAAPGGRADAAVQAPARRHRQPRERPAERLRAARTGAPPAAESAPAPQPDPERGYLSVDSQPYATIYSGDRELGVTPLIRQPMPAGRHRLRAVTAAGDERRFEVVIAPGRTAPPVQLRWPQ